MKESWEAKGGISAYAEHVKEVALKFPHVSIHPELWLKNIPSSSASCHVFLKAIQLLAEKGELVKSFDDIVWQFRLAFFRDNIDISILDEQLSFANRLVLPVEDILEQLNKGYAHAALESDQQQKSACRVAGSPTLNFNEGRQSLYGNVGYRIMEANVDELLQDNSQHASWC